MDDPMFPRQTYPGQLCADPEAEPELLVPYDDAEDPIVHAYDPAWVAARVERVHPFNRKANA